MAIKDDDQLRAWCVDYALRLQPPKTTTKPEKIICAAKKFEAYITARPPCEIKLFEPRLQRKKQD